MQIPFVAQRAWSRGKLHTRRPTAHRHLRRGRGTIWLTTLSAWVGHACAIAARTLSPDPDTKPVEQFADAPLSPGRGAKRAWTARSAGTLAVEDLDMRQSYELTVDRIAGVLIVRVAGQLDTTADADLERCLGQAGRFRRRVLVDLSDVTFMDSAGLDVLLSARDRLGDRLELIVPPDSPPARLLQLTGRKRSFTIHRASAQAL